MAGSRCELEEFSEECRSQSKLNVEITIPRLNALLPSHKFVEVLYNRLANDLALWEPKCPLFKETRSASTAGPPPTLFRPFAASNTDDMRRMSDETEEDDSDLTLRDRYSSKLRRKQRAPALSPSSAHQLSLTLRVEKARLLLMEDEVHPKLDNFTSQIGGQISNAEVFLVFGYNENSNLSYFYTTMAKATVYHKSREILNQSCFRITNSLI